MKEFESDLYNNGINFIAGIDEVGRGPLIGPVVTAAVILPKDFYDERINDSKKLTEKKRELLYDVIMENALSVGIGVGAGTEGIGIDLSTPLTKYVQARIGINIMPDISVNTTATATIQQLNSSEKIDIKGGIGRTTFDLKFDCYPFPNATSFFVTAS